MSQDTPVVMAVHVVLRENERCVGLAFVDMTKRQLGMTEFLDDDQFTSLESAMVALGCRECVIPQSTVAKSPDDRKLRDVMARCNVLVTEKKKTDFRYPYIWHLILDVRLVVPTYVTCLVCVKNGD